MRDKKGAAASLAKEEWDIEMNVSPKTSSTITKNSSDETSENNQNQKGEERSP